VLDTDRTPIAANRRRLLLASTAVWLLIACAHPAAAQSPGGGAVVLPPLRVEGVSERPVDGYLATRSRTATKTDTPLIDVPQAATVITREAIKDQDMQSMGDVIRYIPGMNLHQGEGNRDQVVIRGNSTTADFFLDGVRDDVQYFRDLYNIDRVEALKGPNAMIFGRGGSGGVINRVLKEADGTQVREVSGTFGAFDKRRFAGDVGDAVNDKVSVRLNGLYENSGSFRDHVSLERVGINPTATFRPREDTRIKLGYEFFDDHRTADRGIPSQNGRPFDTDRSTFFGNPDLSHAEIGANHARATLEHDTAFGVKVRNHTQFSDFDKIYQNVFPNSPVDANGLVTLQAYNNAIQRHNLTNQTDLTGTLETGPISHKLLGGMEFSRQQQHTFRNTGFFNGTATSLVVPASSPTVFTPPVVFRQSATDGNTESRVGVAAVYGQDQIEITKYLQLIGGVRFDSVDQNFADKRAHTEFGRTDELISPRGGVVVKPIEQLSLYVSYSKSYLPASGDQFTTLTDQTRGLEPEELENHEIGAKWDVMPLLSLTVAAYELHRTNTRANDPANPGRFVLTGEQRSQGIELGASGQITDNWQILGGYAFQDAKVVAGTTAARPGARVPLVPEHTVSLWNRYNFTERWGAGLGVLHQTKVYASIDNTVTLPSFTRVDAALFYTFADNFRAQVNIENLFDATYYATADQNNNISPGSPIGVRFGLTANF
jgi:catecholate siderophore receptor